MKRKLQRSILDVNLTYHVVSLRTSSFWPSDRKSPMLGTTTLSASAWGIWLGSASSKCDRAWQFRGSDGPSDIG